MAVALIATSTAMGRRYKQERIFEETYIVEIPRDFSASEAKEC